MGFLCSYICVFSTVGGIRRLFADQKRHHDSTGEGGGGRADFKIRDATFLGPIAYLDDIDFSGGESDPG